MAENCLGASAEVERWGRDAEGEEKNSARGTNIPLGKCTLLSLP